jgi:hypothetical protein
MANNIREAPIPDTGVKGSPNKKMEIAIAVITSINRMTVEVAGEMSYRRLFPKWKIPVIAAVRVRSDSW